MSGSDSIANPDQLEVVPGFQHDRLQGWVPDLANEDELRDALEKAFDYRGDVTVTRRDGSVVNGYLYDRRAGQTLQNSLVRILPGDGSPRLSIPYADVMRLAFSDRDPAAGKTWEAWVRKYWEKHAAGEKAEIQPEALD